MGKKTNRRRKMANYIRGLIGLKMAITSLGSRDLVSTATSTVIQRTLVSSIEAIFAMSGLYAESDEGPIMVGVAHSDYTDAEIEEAIEATGSWDPGNKIEREKSSRMVRKIGIFRNPDPNADTGTVLNGGEPLKVKLNWVLNEGDGLKLWAYNTGGAALTVEAPDVVFEGHANLFTL